MDSERWASIPDWHDVLISDEGNVRRLLDDGTWRPMKPWRNSKGYLKVTLGSLRCTGATCRAKSKAKQHRHRKEVFIHRAIWQAFMGEIPDDMRVDHRDDDKRHNTLANLQLLTNVDNVLKQWEERRRTA